LILRVGVLSGGGDAPGTNAAIRAVVRKGILQYRDAFFGVKDGWRGLLEDLFVPLDLDATAGILPLGGSILGFSRTNPFKHEQGVEKVLENFKRKGLDALIVVGGDDTLGVTHKMGAFGLNCVGVPKTIDNDLSGTDYTLGFNTAVSIATETLDRLHSTAEAHHRVMILEVMGRYTGWIALAAGIAGGADAILIPEKAFSVAEICQYIRGRKVRGRNFSLVIVAEGAKPEGGKEVLYGEKVDEFGNVRFGGVGYWLGKEIEKNMEIETRVVVLGHLQRGGTPTAFDRILATRYGVHAIDLVHQKQFGKMIALRGDKITQIELEKVIGKRKKVSQELLEVAEVFFG
jgi:phosphofructokinase-like protein